MAFRRRRAIAQSAVWPDGVVVDAPLLDQDLGLAQGMEQLTIEQFTAEPGIEALSKSLAKPIAIGRRYQ